jgi:hypothetical protein
VRTQVFLTQRIIKLNLNLFFVLNDKYGVKRTQYKRISESRIPILSSGDWSGRDEERCLSLCCAHTVSVSLCLMPRCVCVCVHVPMHVCIHAELYRFAYARHCDTCYVSLSLVSRVFLSLHVSLSVFAGTIIRRNKPLHTLRLRCQGLVGLCVCAM